jgi:hypothetical protein
MMAGDETPRGAALGPRRQHVHPMKNGAAISGAAYFNRRCA